MRFNALLNDAVRVEQVAQQTTRQTFGEARLDKPELLKEVTATMQRLVALFARGGFDAVAEQVEQTVPEAKRREVLDAYIKVLRNILTALYFEVLTSEGVDLAAGVSEADSQFYDDSINALAVLPRYGSPFFLELKSFEHVQASGLQIAKAPGQIVVYSGFALLIAGVFVMFYIHHRRLWFWIRARETGTELLFAGAGNREQRDFHKEFERLTRTLDQQLRSG